MIDIMKLQEAAGKEILKMNSNFSVVFIDIDFFLRYCMKFTKQECDDIMEQIEIYLKEKFLKYKWFHRKNNDEFIIILENFNNNTARQLMEEVLQKFRRQRFLKNLGDEYQYIRMTFSAGIASYPENGGKDIILRKAITALFMAKAMRRNYIQFYDTEQTIHRIRIVEQKDAKIDTVAGHWGIVGQTKEKVNVSACCFWEPQSITISSNGALYIADQNNHQILKYQDGFVEVVVGTGQYGAGLDGEDGTICKLNKPTSVFAGENYLYISDTGNDTVLKYDYSTHLIHRICGIGHAGIPEEGMIAKKAPLNKPGGVVVDAEGLIYINDIANGVIRRINHDGIITTYAGNGIYGFNGDGHSTKDTSFNEIYSINIDPAGENIYIADYLNHRIRKINIATNVVTTEAGIGISGYEGDGGPPEKARLNRPVGVCVDNKGNLYIAESGNQCIRVIKKKENVIYTLIGGVGMGTGVNETAEEYALANPNSVAVHENILYILDGANNRIIKMNLVEENNE